MAKCITCKQDVPREECTVVNKAVLLKSGAMGNDSLRCSCCNNSKACLDRFLTLRCDMSLRIKDHSPNERSKFIASLHGKMGDDLEKAVVVEAERCNINKLTTSFTGAGDFLDKMELEEKYKQRPEQLESIIQNAPSFLHPDRGCQVWLDRAYNLSEAHTNVKEEVERMTMSGETKVKRRKTEKEKKEKSEKREKEKVDKPLSQPQIKKVESMKAKLDKARTKLEETLKSSEEAANQEFLNPKVLDKARGQCKLLNTSITSLDLLVEVNTGGNEVQKELAPIAKQLEETQTLQTLLKAQLDCSSEL